MKLGIGPIGNVARLVDLAALDRDVSPKGPADCFGQGLGAINDEEAADFGVQSALDQIVQQRLHGCAVLRCPLDYAQRVFLPVGIPVGIGPTAASIRRLSSM